MLPLDLFAKSTKQRLLLRLADRIVNFRLALCGEFPAYMRRRYDIETAPYDITIFYQCIGVSASCITVIKGTTCATAELTVLLTV